MPPRIDATPGAQDASSTDVGGFVTDWVFQPNGLDLCGWPVEALDPLFGLTLHVVRGAVSQTGIDPGRTGLWLANLGLPTTGAVRATATPWLAHGLDLPWLGGGQPLDRWQSALPAQLAAQVFGFADAVALDAACASGLYAVQLGADRLATGEVDVAVIAAVNRSDSSYLFNGFSQLRALSTSGQARPLDRRADGLIVGEGAAAIVLKRVADAVRDGDRIHAILRGTGLGNDGRKGNMLAPSGDGQLRAMRAAWRRAGLSPATLGAVECHATGTPVGDGIELTSLHRLLDAAGGTSTPVALGAAKGLIGHTVTAAGLAGLIRAVGGVRDGFLPATPGVEQPNPVLLESPHLRVLDQHQPWPSDVPRRAAVSAFGFGGTNAHLIVDAWDGGSPEPLVLNPTTERLAIVAVGVHIGPHRGPAAVAAIEAGLTPMPAPPSAHRGGALPDGTYVNEVCVDPRRYRIPPIELADLLPRQLLMLDVAADALQQLPALDPTTTASIVGMGVDHHIGEAVMRWAAIGADLPADTVGPPLTAARVQGSLPNFLANRVAAQFDLQGPSWTVSSGPLSGLHALRQASRLLHADDVDVVLVGAVDFAGHVGAQAAAAAHRGALPVVEGAIALVVMTEANARKSEVPIQALVTAPKLDRSGSPSTPLRSAEALEGLLSLLEAMAANAPHLAVQGPCGTHGSLALETLALSASDAARAWDPVLAVPHSGTPLPAKPTWSGSFSDDTLPFPLPAAPVKRLVLQGPVSPNRRALDWNQYSRATQGTPLPTPVRPQPPLKPPVSPVVRAQAADTSPAVQVRESGVSTYAPGMVASLAGAARMAHQVGQSAQILANQHARFLHDQAEAARHLARLADALELASRGLVGDDIAVPSIPADLLAPQLEHTRESRGVPIRQTGPRRTFDKPALLAHAGGDLSACMGPGYADLDAYTPRVRMPMPPLLLCDRVVDIEGERGVFGPSRIVTEYDIPKGQQWSADGRPPPCVMVESGQADLFLVSWLGIDAELQGKRIYRLLDCDLIFHGPRPEPGETLRHDIRIDRFARLGANTLFYFHYDCTAVSDGRSVLSMRNGCAGFFTPEELATPRGVVERAHDLPTHPAMAPLVEGAPPALDEAAVLALAAGDFSGALGPAFRAANGSSLTLPPDPRWRLVHRVPTLRTSGGPHGLGEVVFEQDLRDDDWFNPCHFVDDPCMPGTLMFDGCQQAVQLWLLARGAAVHWPEGRFDPMPEVAAKLRCRGQVVPGHTLLRYHARIKQAGDSPAPWAIADVILEVDGTEVVLAEDVSVHVHGPKAVPKTVPDDLVMAYSIGSAERAFGPAWRDYDHGKRCARMPGPPYLTMSRVTHIDHPAMAIDAPASVTIDWEIPDRAWYFEANKGESLSFAILLEASLQPCGWLTAWQGMSIEGDRDLYFRNLGGTATQFAEVWPHTGTLSTTVTLSRTSASGGIRVVFFTSEVWAGSVKIFQCTTNFGYFSKAALSAQKGLSIPEPRQAELAALVAATQLAEPLSLEAHSALPRDDWRMLHALDCADKNAGVAGLGFYRGTHTVNPDQWFFHAHFHLDPVMPGSLGLEALLQLARVALVDHLGPQTGRWVPLTLEQEVSWTYRGQVLRHIREMTAELEVLELVDGDQPIIRCRGTIRADGLPIYAFDDFGLTVVANPCPTAPPVISRPRATPLAALLDQFDVQGDQGTGLVHLDPSQHPWLADHCPTVTMPAVPMAFAAEIAAEAASLLRPGAKVVGLPLVEAQRWIHTGDGPIDLLVVAVAEGDTVAVSLAVHEDNPRFPTLSGPKVHMRAVVQMGANWCAPAPAPAVDPAAFALDIDDYYTGGHTFHGPTLRAMTALTHLDKTGARATLQTRDDAELLHLDAQFVLDPLLLDAATHPMWSAEPERWVPDLAPGHLAYPVRCDNLRLMGPRPDGDVRCCLTHVPSEPGTLVFDVHLQGDSGPWCSYRWTEAIVPAGPYLGLSAKQRRAFLWNRQPCAEAQVGSAVGNGWRVQLDDVVEPLPGTLAHIACTNRELRDRAQAEDKLTWDLGILAAKGCLIHHLQRRLGRTMHPADLTLLCLRSDVLVVLDAPTLTAEEYSRHLGPTRWCLTLSRTSDSATATLAATGSGAEIIE
jgi:3-oxoacyl-(acyl-carrier-protein) synthase/3-hydroxymyristoyl/3-hydroxydecanoyl-(acyl carrier protein) dehydratase